MATEKVVTKTVTKREEPAPSPEARRIQEIVAETEDAVPAEEFLGRLFEEVPDCRVDIFKRNPSGWSLLPGQNNRVYPGHIPEDLAMHCAKIGGDGLYLLRPFYKGKYATPWKLSVGGGLAEEARPGAGETEEAPDLDVTLKKMLHREAAINAISRFRRMNRAEDRDEHPPAQQEDEGMKSGNLIEVVKVIAEAMRPRGGESSDAVAILEARLKEAEQRNHDLLLRLLDRTSNQPHPLTAIAEVLKVLPAEVSGQLLSGAAPPEGWSPRALGELVEKLPALLQALGETVKLQTAIQTRTALPGGAAAPDGGPAHEVFMTNVPNVKELVGVVIQELTSTEPNLDGIISWMGTVPISPDGETLLARVTGLAHSPERLAQWTVRVLDPRLAEEPTWSAVKRLFARCRALQEAAERAAAAQRHTDQGAAGQPGDGEQA